MCLAFVDKLHKWRELRKWVKKKSRIPVWYKKYQVKYYHKLVQSGKMDIIHYYRIFMHAKKNAYYCVNFVNGRKVHTKVQLDKM